MKIELKHQIEVAEREAEIRRMGAQLNPTPVKRVELQAMEAIVATLKWLKENETAIRASVRERKEIEALPEVRAIAEAFPGAKMTVRRTA